MAQWIDASSISGEDGLDDEQILQWRESGYALVGGLLSDQLIETMNREATDLFPAPGTADAANVTGFGSKGQVNFPSPISVFNELTLDPGILKAVSQLLDVPVSQLRLTQSDLWPKYGRDHKRGIQDNQDQRIHVDYPNHTMAHPTPWHRPEAVEMIVYFSEVEETGGPTAVVPRMGSDDPAYRWPIVDSPGIGDLKYVNDKAEAERYFASERPALADWRASLYEREKLVRYQPGDVLFYRHDTWHRGTPMKPGTLRYVLNMTYRLARSEWISTLHIGWAWRSYAENKYLARLLSTASLEQRAVMGFPQPGSEYWCEETIVAIKARYGMYGFDVTPYRDALK